MLKTLFHIRMMDIAHCSVLLVRFFFFFFFISMSFSPFFPVPNDLYVHSFTFLLGRSVLPMEVLNSPTTWTHFSMLIMSLRYIYTSVQHTSHIASHGTEHHPNCNDETGIFLTPLV
jgi:hypothetical protein